MRKFKRNKSLEDVKAGMIELGYMIPKTSLQAYDNGSDYLMFTKDKWKVFYNTFNGTFFISEIIGSASFRKYDTYEEPNIDNTEDYTKYDQILDAFYTGEIKKEKVVKQNENNISN